MRLGLLALFSLVACDTTKISQDEAELIYGAQNELVGSIGRTALDAVKDSDVPEGLTVELTDSSASISGTVQGDGDWTGSVAVDGTASADTDNDVYGVDLNLSASQANVEGVVLDGESHLLLDAEYDLDIGMVYFNFDTGGDVTASGEVQGLADFSYTMLVDVNLSTGEFEFDASGEVAGFNVTGLAVADLASWVLSLYQ